jgi:hypothetical protein
MFSSICNHYITIDNWTLLGVRQRYPAARTMVETWSADDDLGMHPDSCMMGPWKLTGDKLAHVKSVPAAAR